MATCCGKNCPKIFCVITESISAKTNIFFLSFFTSMQDGISPMYAASHEGHTEVVGLLVQAGADVHLATTKVHVSTHTVSSSVPSFVETVRLINPQHALAARVTVVGCVRLSVHLLSHISSMQLLRHHASG